MSANNTTGLFFLSFFIIAVSVPSVPTVQADRNKNLIRHNHPSQQRHQSTPRYRTTPQHRSGPLFRSNPRYQIPQHRVKPGPRIYRPHGHTIRVLPRTHRRIIVRKKPYYYYSGLFYRSAPSGYVVIRAPIGARIRILPRGFVRFYIGGIPYFYVNYIYYSWLPDVGMYVVVDRPSGSDVALARVTSDDLIIYPKNNQSDKQRAKDRLQCHQWSTKETGYDPGVPDEGGHLRKRYRKAITVCLEARGYAVK